MTKQKEMIKTKPPLLNDLEITRARWNNPKLRKARFVSILERNIAQAQWELSKKYYEG